MIVYSLPLDIENYYPPSMKRYKVKEVLKMLKEEGWYLDRQKGSHRQFKNKTKNSTVTVNGKLSDVLPQNNLNSIFKQAGWR